MIREKITFEFWADEVKALLIDDYGFTDSIRIDKEGWGPYFEDGLTPREAIREDLSYA